MEFNINFDNNYGFKELNPATCQDTSTANILHNIYKGLFFYNGITLTPGMLNELKFDEQQNTYTFFLRECVWSDHSPVVSADFVSAWMSVIKGMDINIEFFKMIKNVNSYLSGKSTEDDIGINIINNKMFSVTLEYDCPHFLHITASTPYLPLPQNIKKDKIGYVGNSNFIIKENNIKSMKLAHVSRPIEINISCDCNEESIHHKFVNKEIDFSDGIPVNYMSMYAEQGLINYVPEFGTSFIQFNCENLNLNQRTLVENTINKEQLVTAYLQNEKTDNFIPWHLINESNTSTTQIKKSLNGSTTGLAFHNKSIQFLVNNLDLYVNIAKEIKEQIENGLECSVELIVCEWEDFVERLRNGKYDIVLSGWIGDYFDPYSMLSIWHSGSSNNYASFNNENYDSLLIKSQEIRDEIERYQLFALAENVLLEQKVLIPLYHYRLPLLIQSNYKEHLNFSPLGIIDLNSIDYKKGVFTNETK
ncbi:ABC transporter substrate-binding protein [Priestia koreensis]|uniref:ABC transporter substrate-binding protein n=1 Tax=Priestia koreensis TaxID=284581 RepID=UPI001F587F13|nr:ABC transporter substrate-binding protein [Priestia koreensis]UNL87538.1 hypothetical protein IE339_23830 [Priestia koreensis]